jgi:transposase
LVFPETHDMLQIKISKAEIQRLNYERYHYPCPIVQKRIHAVYLKLTTTLTMTEIGKLTGCCRDSVTDWSNIYEEKGIEGLCKFNYGTNRSILEKHADSLLQSFRERPPLSCNEAVARIKKMTGIGRSPTQVRAFMQRHGLRYLKMGHIPAKADGVRQREWVEKELKPVIRQAKEGKCHLLFMDAAHFILQPFICAVWCIVRMFIKASSGRNRINVLGAVNAMTREITTLTNTSYITAETIIEFLKQLRKKYTDVPLKIVLDNARYQHCRIVEQEAHRLGITLMFLPSYSPNLNIIERLWKFTKKKILYAKYYESPSLFHKAITGFFQTINKKHNNELNRLLTLKFQFFENENAEIYPV